MDSCVMHRSFSAGQIISHIALHPLSIIEVGWAIFISTFILHSIRIDHTWTLAYMVQFSVSSFVTCTFISHSILSLAATSSTSFSQCILIPNVHMSKPHLNHTSLSLNHFVMSGCYCPYENYSILSSLFHQCHHPSHTAWMISLPSYTSLSLVPYCQN